jgi:M6 family metalloprotease-like protein
MIHMNASRMATAATRRSLQPLFVLAALAFALSAQPAVAHTRGEHDGTVPEARSETVETVRGTVAEIIVDDATRGTSRRHVELTLGNGTRIPLSGSTAETLSSGMSVEVSGRHRGRPLEVSSARALAQPRDVQPPEATDEVDGDLAILHADYFESDQSTFIYEMRDASGHYRRLRMASTLPSLEPGMKLRVRGRIEAADELTPQRITVLARPAAPSDVVAQSVAASSVLVITANFNNTVLPAMTSEQAQAVMTGNSDSVANFFRETSYGQQIMNVTVTPQWVIMNMPRPASCGSSDWRGIGTAAEAASRSLGAAYEPANYDFVVYVFPAVSACGWTGLAYIGQPHKAWINGTSAFRTNTIAHEMGHNFGLLHAASLRCTGASIGGSCSSSEYGDPFDAMGNQRPMHYNAMQKAKLAWIAPATVKTHAGGSATYTIGPLELAGMSTYAVKVPTGVANRTYWLEFRQPTGFDAPLASYPSNGAQVRVAAPFETQCAGCDAYSDDTQLLDMTPGTSTFNDATLPAGQSFTDPQYGIQITVVSATADALTVQVGTGGTSTPPPPPPPSPTATTTTVGSSTNPATAGMTITLAATVTGNAPTGSVRFFDNGNGIAGCDAIALGGSGNARNASCATNALAAGSHSIVATYAGDSANATSTSASLTQVMNAPVKGTNVALASNGGIASASSAYSAGYGVAGVNDNRRAGVSWGNGGGWNDGTPSAFPDWVQIRFSGQRTINQVVVYTVQDNYSNPVEPSDSTTFTLYGLTDFDVQSWNGAAWVTLGSVRGNNLVKRTVAFDPVTTDRIRINAIGSKDGVWSRITEIEAWSPTPTGPQETNFALAGNGGVASASSMYNAAYAPAGTVDGDRAGVRWGNGGGWNDGTMKTTPDWLQVAFSGAKSIDRIVVYTVQDNYAAPLEPTDEMTFTKYGLTDFDVQGRSSRGAWVTLASVAGNRLVKRTVTFAPFTTTAVRIVAKKSADGTWSRITELEAWGR